MAPPTAQQISKMNYSQLRQACRKAGLPVSGKTKALQSRLRGWVNKKGVSSSSSCGGGKVSRVSEGGGEPTAKRQKRSAADDLTCPITLELPFDPVMAEDGRVYERVAIEKYFATKRNSRKVLSPITKEKIGKNLIAAPQIRNHIETLVEDGIITGDLAVKWNKQMQEKKHVEDLLKRAEQGDIEAMVDVAQNYDFGSEGFSKNEKKAFEWYEKAREAGSIIGAACIGETLLKSDGVNWSKRMRGLMYLTSAAERGSDFAAYWLGKALVSGALGVPVDLVEGRKWLERAASSECTVIHLLDEDKENIPTELERLSRREQEDDDDL